MIASSRARSNASRAANISPLRAALIYERPAPEMNHSPVREDCSTRPNSCNRIAVRFGNRPGLSGSAKLLSAAPNAPPGPTEACVFDSFFFCSTRAWRFLSAALTPPPLPPPESNPMDANNCCFLIFFSWFSTSFANSMDCSYAAIDEPGLMIFPISSQFAKWPFSSRHALPPILFPAVALKLPLVAALRRARFGNVLSFCGVSFAHRSAHGLLFAKAHRHCA